MKADVLFLFLFVLLVEVLTFVFVYSVELIVLAGVFGLPPFLSCCPSSRHRIRRNHASALKQIHSCRFQYFLLFVNVAADPEADGGGRFEQN